MEAVTNFSSEESLSREFKLEMSPYFDPNILVVIICTIRINILKP